MHSFFLQDNRLVAAVRHPFAMAVIATMLVAGCAPWSSSGSADPKADATPKAPRLVKKDSTVAWVNKELFAPVPAELQASGNAACNAAGGSAKMKAVGYHPQAMRLDGSQFPKGGFLCAADESSVAAGAAAPTAKSQVSAIKPAGPNLAELDARTQSWAKAWASKDLNAYFGFYSANFKPSGFANVAAWKESRTARINKTGPIAVELSNISSKNLSGGAVETRFSQNYSSANFKDTSAKSLIWANEGGQWKIVSESNR